MRKTRRQKITADLHRQLYSLRSRKVPSFEQKPTANISALLAEPQKYNYLTADISKTGVVTGAIIIAQLIFSFLLKNHLLTIPGISY
ncbi:MAG: hypothetical protein AAB609_04480 [Patescibacteria group bacterium]